MARGSPFACYAATGLSLWIATGLFLGMPGMVRDNARFAGPVERTWGWVSHLHRTSRGACRAEYRYVDTQGTVHSAQAKIVEPTWRLLIGGGPIPLKYLPDDPAKNRVDTPGEDTWYRQMPWTFLAYPPIIVLLAALMAWRDRLRNAARRRAS